jgi:hypothetical protein
MFKTQKAPHPDSYDNPLRAFMVMLTNALYGLLRDSSVNSGLIDSVREEKDMTWRYSKQSSMET